MKRALGLKRPPGTREGLTRPMAERRLRELMSTVCPAPEERITVEDAGKRLLRRLETLGRKRSTVSGYESALRVHLAPWFGNKPLDRITGAHVEAFITAKRADGLTAKSTLNYVGFLHSVFEYAMRNGWVDANPVKQVDKPQPESGDADVRFLTIEEIEALLRAVPTDDLGRVERALYRAAVTTGMRQGELVALRWRDIDWSAKRIRVRRNYVQGEFGTPKSKRSSRSVPLTDRLGRLRRPLRPLAPLPAGARA